MSINFEKGWLQHTADHVTTEVLARRLILSAAWGLSQNKRVEVIRWCKAAERSSSDAHFLQVTKGLHQLEGPFQDLMHITMRLYIPGSRPGDLVPDTHFRGKFHLYAKILKPQQDGCRLLPTRLSYDTLGNAMDLGNFLRVDITNVEPTMCDLASKH